MMQQSLTLVWHGAAVVVLLMGVLWAIHLRIRNAAIVDFGWGLGIALIAVLYAIEGPGYAPRKWLIASMAGIWGLRLSIYLLFDRVISKPEEGRYQQLRREWKTSLPLKFFFFFQFQALLCVLLSVPFLFAVLNSRNEISWLEYAAAGLWLLGLAGEVAADWQLAAFKASPANQGKLCRAGLWNYSRHPNYFFEWLIWVAYAMFALASPWGFVALLCPALMLYFLLRVTGIPATEAQALRSRGEMYRRYQQTTSAFVPWFPKKEGWT